MRFGIIQHPAYNQVVTFLTVFRFFYRCKRGSRRLQSRRRELLSLLAKSAEGTSHCGRLQSQRLLAKSAEGSSAVFLRSAGIKEDSILGGRWRMNCGAGVQKNCRSAKKHSQRPSVYSDCSLVRWECLVVSSLLVLVVCERLFSSGTHKKKLWQS